MATVTFQQNSSYQGTIDTTLYQANRDAFSGDSSVVSVDGGSGVKRQALLEFTNIFGDGLGQIPIGATITSATLTLDTTNPAGGKVSVYRMLTGWSEASTWNSLGGGVQLGTEAFSTADLVTGSKIGLGSSTFNVTNSLMAWLSGATTADQANQANLGWMFQMGSTDGWNFNSSETGSAPILTVTYTMGTVGASQLALAGAVTQAEGTSSSPTDFTFTVNRTGDTSDSATVKYAVTGSGVSKAAASDFAGNVLPSGTVTFAAGETSKTITISVRADSTIEGDQTFKVTLSSPTGGATITGATATGTIVNDDFPLGIVGLHIFAGSAYGAGYPSNSPNHYGSTDPTDLAYDPATGSFYLCDSEVDEKPFFSINNLWKLDGAANLQQGISLENFTHEPTGLALWIDTNGNKHLFVADDDQQRVFEVDPANPTVVLQSFSTLPFGCTDPEDLCINPNNGNLFVLSEKNFTIYEVTQDGSTVVSKAVLPSIFKYDNGVASLEGIAYDATNDRFFVCGGFSPDIYVISRTGQILQTIDLLSHYTNSNGAHVYPKGLELAPSSDGSGHLSLWVTDYGKDQVADGRIFEIVLDRPASETPSFRMLASQPQSATTMEAAVTGLDDGGSHKASHPGGHHFPTSVSDLGLDHHLPATHVIDYLS